MLGAYFVASFCGLYLETLCIFFAKNKKNTKKIIICANAVNKFEIKRLLVSKGQIKPKVFFLN